MSRAQEAEEPIEDTDAHDVLAAEEFAMPSADPSIHHGPVVLPDDPTGILEPHDILAAEEFAMPAVRSHPPFPQRRGGLLPPPWALTLAGALILFGRRRRHRPRGL